MLTRTELVAVTLTRCDMLRAGFASDHRLVLAASDPENVPHAMHVYGDSAAAVIKALDQHCDGGALDRRIADVARDAVHKGLAVAGAQRRNSPDGY